MMIRFWGKGKHNNLIVTYERGAAQRRLIGRYWKINSIPIYFQVILEQGRSSQGREKVIISAKMQGQAS